MGRESAIIADSTAFPGLPRITAQTRRKAAIASRDNYRCSPARGIWVGEGLGGTLADVFPRPKTGVLPVDCRLPKAYGKPGFYEMFTIG